MIIHNFDPVLIDLGLFQIRWYSVAYIFGIIIGWVYALKIIKITQNNTHNFKSIKKSDFDDLIIYLVLGIILGGRLGYVIFYNLEYYSQNFFEIFPNSSPFIKLAILPKKIPIGATQAIMSEYLKKLIFLFLEKIKIETMTPSKPP